MKKLLFLLFILVSVSFGYGQTIYYWVGGTSATTGINTTSNWNTSITGTGSPRSSSSTATDILIFDGSNLGGATPATGPADILGSGSITCAQMKFVNNVNVTLSRPTSGTSTITIAGEAGEDFLVEAGSTLKVISPLGSLRFTFNSTVDAARMSGTMALITSQQMRFENGTTGAPGIFRFTNGSSFTTNITSSSTSYAFGNSSQSGEKWVVFEDGAHLYYEGGYSPMGSTSGYSAIDFKPNSTWHHKADNPTSGSGSFFNNKSFGNISVENGATLAADGPIYRINNLTINNGTTFKTHSSGQTAVMGNLTVNGSLTADVSSSNELVLAGAAAQNVSGTGTITVPTLIIADKASVTLNMNIAARNAAVVYGKVNFTNKQITGDGSFTAKSNVTAVNATGNTIAGAYIIKGNAGITGNVRGYSISGAGIPANTVIIDLSATEDTIYISQPATATATGVALSANSGGAYLQTANTNGFNALNGSVALTGGLAFQDRISYQFDAATTTPFGPGMSAFTRYVVTTLTVNADITINHTVDIVSRLNLDAKLTVRAGDSLHFLAGATYAGAFGATKYVATAFNAAANQQGKVVFDAFAGGLFPLGTPTAYLPLTLTPSATAPFTFTAFTEITANGALNGTAFTALQKQAVVNAVWQITNPGGGATGTLSLGWPDALEGSTFSTLPDTDIGLITNDGTGWTVPVSTASNTNNTTVPVAITAFGSFGVGAIPQADPFVFNALADRTYGEADFNGGATSLNTAQPIMYTSSNTAVATIVAGNIHIVGTGTTTITASQATDGLYPAASISQTLNVLKANLTIKADNKTKFETLPNPTLTATYTGFAYGQTAAALLTPVVLTTTATTSSAPGTYPITASGATSNNYNISFENGTLTILPKQTQTITFAAPPVKTYGAADFTTGAVSTNTTTPITYSVSNPQVATISGNTIHIVGAGTTTITAMQAGSDGFFPATSVVRTLTVNKAALTIRVRDTTKVQGQPNPPFTITYSGFVNGETAAVLSPGVSIRTLATTTSSPGVYPLVLEGGGSNNYAVTYVNGNLTIMPTSNLDKQQLFAYWNGSAITVKIYSPTIALGDVLVYDLNGKFLAKRNVLINAGFASVDVNLPTLSAGVYSIAVQGKGVDLHQLIQVIR